jgi:hypothetical protein
VEQGVRAHAQSDRSAFSNAKMIKKRQGVQRTLPVRDRSSGIGRPSVPASVGLNERIFAGELVATGMDPILAATCTAMEKQERLSRALGLVVHFDVVNRNGFAFHALNYGGEQKKKQSCKYM